MDRSNEHTDVPDVLDEEAKLRGFARLSPEQRRAVARKGGLAAQQKGVAHRFTPHEAARAGVKGGVAAHAKGVAHQFTRATGQAANLRSQQARRQKRKGDEDGHGEAGGHG